MIADASSGFQRAFVIIYVCAPEASETAPILAAARDYAAARDWVAVAEVIERASPDRAMALRDGWQQVRESIDARTAQGIVMATSASCAHDHPDHAQLREWLGERHAFLVATAPRPRDDDRGVPRADRSH